MRAHAQVYDRKTTTLDRSQVTSFFLLDKRGTSDRAQAKCREGDRKVSRWRDFTLSANRAADRIRDTNESTAIRILRRESIRQSRGNAIERVHAPFGRFGSRGCCVRFLDESIGAYCGASRVDRGAFCATCFSGSATQCPTVIPPKGETTQAGGPVCKTGPVSRPPRYIDV